MFGFIRRQEEKLAVRLLAWRYTSLDLPLPPYADLEAQAREVVDEAHRIAKKRGSNIMAIIRELTAGISRPS